MLDSVSGGEGGGTVVSHKTSSLLQLLTPSTLTHSTLNTSTLYNTTQIVGGFLTLLFCLTSSSGCTYAVVGASGPSGPSILQFNSLPLPASSRLHGIVIATPSRVNGGAPRRGAHWLSAGVFAETPPCKNGRRPALTVKKLVDALSR